MSNACVGGNGGMMRLSMRRNRNPKLVSFSFRQDKTIASTTQVASCKYWQRKIVGLTIGRKIAEFNLIDDS
jgi:hypothetical protein